MRVCHSGCVRRRLRPGLQRRVSSSAVCRRTSRMMSHPLKLALVTRRYPPLIGGAEKVLSYLAEALAREGALVTVLTSRAPGTKDLPRREEVPIPSACGRGRLT